MNKITVVFTIAAMGFLSGCSLDASLLPLSGSSGPGFSLQKASGAEFVSGATPTYETTALRHYKVQVSVGSFISKPVQTSVGRGYKVYSSVQGSMFSDGQ